MKYIHTVVLYIVHHGIHASRASCVRVINCDVTVLYYIYLWTTIFIVNTTGISSIVSVSGCHVSGCVKMWLYVPVCNVSRSVRECQRVSGRQYQGVVWLNNASRVRKYQGVSGCDVRAGRVGKCQIVIVCWWRDITNSIFLK